MGDTEDKRVSLPNLMASTKTISLRLPETLLDRIKIEANRRDMPYQSLIMACDGGCKRCGHCHFRSQEQR